MIGGNFKFIYLDIYCYFLSTWGFWQIRFFFVYYRLYGLGVKERMIKRKFIYG